MKQQFTIHGTLPGMNEIVGAARTHWSASAAMKKNATEVCAEAARGLKPCTRPVVLLIAWFEKDARRDCDNIMAATKFLCDGLVQAKVLPDDSQKYVTSIAHVVAIDKAHPRICVEIEEKEAE